MKWFLLEIFTSNSLNQSLFGSSIYFGFWGHMMESSSTPSLFDVRSSYQAIILFFCPSQASVARSRVCLEWRGLKNSWIHTQIKFAGRTGKVGCAGGSCRAWDVFEKRDARRRTHTEHREEHIPLLSLLVNAKTRRVSSSCWFRKLWFMLGCTLSWALLNIFWKINTDARTKSAKRE